MDKRLNVHQAGTPVKVVHKGGIAKSVSAIYLGLAQIVSFGAPTPAPALRRRSDSEALTGDWIKVGGDMYAAIEHERQRVGK